MRFLMSIKNPSPAVVEAIEAAVAWFEQTQLKGIKWIEKNDDRVVVKDPDGGRSGHAFMRSAATGRSLLDVTAWLNTTSPKSNTSGERLQLVR